MQRIVVLVACALLISFIANESRAKEDPSIGLQRARQKFEMAVAGKPPTRAEIDDVIRDLTQVINSGLKTPNDEKTARLLLASSYRYKYSLLESPDWTNTKGGPEVLRNARAQLEAALKIAPRDKQLLYEYAMVLSLSGADAYPVIKKIAEFYPNESASHASVAHAEFQKGNPQRGRESISQAIIFAESPQRLAAYMSQAVDSFDSASCPLKPDVSALLERMPLEHRFPEVAGQDVPSKLPSELKGLQERFVAGLRQHNCRKNEK